MATPDFPVQRANMPLFERRPEAWPLALMVNRLEEPLRELRIRALESEDEGDARTLMAAFGCSSGDEYHSVEQDAQWLADRVPISHGNAGSTEDGANHAFDAFPLRASVSP